ncbi:MAG: hypothetical protein JWM21_2094 [Acidobacteria bacterium]|nr:hypothetical protein [Acidobacteriota bacterium]
MTANCLICLSLSIFHLAFIIRGFNLEVRQKIVYRFAQRGEMFIAGGPFVSPKLRRCAIAFCPPRRSFCCRVSLLAGRDLWACAPGYKHLAPLERKRVQLFALQVEATIDDWLFRQQTLEDALLSHRARGERRPADPIHPPGPGPGPQSSNGYVACGPEKPDRVRSRYRRP